MAGYPEEFINFLEKPESYPHNPLRVEHIQTHISHVFITSPYVYKFKKPVNFEFLDFSSIKKRKYYCDQEVKLNQRLCSDIYIDVIPVYRKGNSWTFDKPPNAEPYEYAVRMKQLSNEHFLFEYAQKGILTTRQLDRVVSKLADFYRNQTPDKEISKWGEPARIKINTDENFEQTKFFINDTIDAVVYHSIRSFTNKYLDQKKSLFEKRVCEGRIVDGHGDLHLEHIHMTGEKVCIYDCIEFNKRFRYQDIAADIAFLAMDLDFNSYKNESNYLVKQMSEKLDDSDLIRLADFYKCYRAYVRGKVKSMESHEKEVGDTGWERAARVAVRYFALSLKYAVTGSKPTLLVCMGRVASGKSTLAQKVAESMGSELYSSDIIRKERAGLTVDERSPLEKRKLIYDDESTVQTYETMFQKAKYEVEKGRNVVLDATFGKRKLRERLFSVFNTDEITIRMVEVHAPEEVRKQRLVVRSTQKKIISDARLEDLDTLDQKYEAPSDDELTERISIRSDRSVENNLVELFQKLSDMQHFGGE